MSTIRNIISELETYKNNFKSFTDDQLYTKLNEVYLSYKDIVKKKPSDTYNSWEIMLCDVPKKYDRKTLESYFNIYITALSDAADIRESQTNHRPSTIINNTNTNNNSSNIEIKITFEQVKEQIQKSNNFDEEEIKKLLEKINELENIVNSKEKKSNKWKKANAIMKYIIDKGIDAGIALLPFFAAIF